MGKNYMAQLERVARWQLPPREADDVIADYQEMVNDPNRSEPEMLRDLGRPRDAIKPLVRKGPYRIWLAVFLVLSFCILTLGFSSFTGFRYSFWWLYFDGWTDYSFGGTLVAVVGAVIAMMWFHQQGRKGAQLPSAIPILLAALLICCGGVMLYCWAGSQDFDSFTEMWGTYTPWIGPNSDTPQSASFYLPREAMVFGSAAIAVAGEFWLVKARTRDRRWAAVYIMALTAILAALSVVALTSSLELSGPTEEHFRRLLFQSTGITLIGLLAAGVALC